MKQVKVRVNTTIEYEVTLDVMDYLNEEEVHNICKALEGMNAEDCNAKEIAVYNDVISWYYVDEELQQTLEREQATRDKWQHIYLTSYLWDMYARGDGEAGKILELLEKERPCE